MDFFDLVSEDDFLQAVREDAKVQAGLDELAAEVKSYWQELAMSEFEEPSGKYAARIRVRKKRDEDGVPFRRVTATGAWAHMIEYGSKHNKKFALRARVGEHFGYEPE